MQQTAGPLAEKYKYSRQLGLLDPILKDKHTPAEVKALIINAILVPTLMYGTYSWSLTTKMRENWLWWQWRPFSQY